MVNGMIFNLVRMYFKACAALDANIALQILPRQWPAPSKLHANATRATLAKTEAPAVRVYQALSKLRLDLLHARRVQLGNRLSWQVRLRMCVFVTLDRPEQTGQQLAHCVAQVLIKSIQVLKIAHYAG